MTSLLRLIRTGWTALGDRSLPSSLVVDAARIMGSREGTLSSCGACHQGLGRPPMLCGRGVKMAGFYLCVFRYSDRGRGQATHGSDGIAKLDARVPEGQPLNLGGVGNPHH